MSSEEQTLTRYFDALKAVDEQVLPAFESPKAVTRSHPRFWALGAITAVLLAAIIAAPLWKGTLHGGDEVDLLPQAVAFNEWAVPSDFLLPQSRHWQLDSLPEFYQTELEENDF